VSGSRRAVLVLPGRGAYTSGSLGSLPVDHALVRRAEELRAGYDLSPLRELDAAARFDPNLHLRAAHSAPLIFLASLLDVEQAANDYELVAGVGNSLGWYAALAVAGVLSFDDAFRLVQEISLLQEEPSPEGGIGGQVIYPLRTADWEPDPELARIVDEVLGAAGPGRVFESVELGAYAVLAGDDAGVTRLLRALPPVTIGERLYPLRLALHGPYHTPLVAHVARAAVERLADLAWRAPELPLIDGTGRRWTRWSTDPAELREYTLGSQLTTPYRFATSVRVALREHAPDLLVLTGPGNSLGGVCGQLVVAEGYRGIGSRAELEAAQAGPEPVLLSMRR